MTQSLPSLYYYPIAADIRECSVNLYREKPQQNFNGSYYFPNPELQCEIHLLLNYAKDDQPTELLNWENRVYLQIYWNYTVYHITAVISKIKTNELNWIETEIDLQSIFCEVITSDKMAEPSMQILIGSESPNPAWVQKYAEGKVELIINIKGNKLLL
jgi:hypothetical protein